MKLRFSLLLVLMAGFTIGSTVSASEKIKGSFELSKDCEAYRSISKKTGKKLLKAGKTYEARQKNKPSPSHYQIAISSSKLLWVAVECGSLNGSAPKISQSAKKKPLPVVKKSRKAKHFLLAMSWQPGFCASHDRKKECRSAKKGDFSSKHLSLHGLWPQPKDNAYCGVSDADKTIDRRGRWDLLQPLKLSSKTKNDLKKYMPGFTSNLQRHEWIKHGTCYSADAETYYADSIRLAKEVDKGSIDELIVSLKGSKITLKKVRQAMVDSFGKGTANSVGLRCDRKNQLTELWIGLYGDPATSSIEEMLKAGKKQYTNCQADSGRVATY